MVGGWGVGTGFWGLIRRIGRGLDQGRKKRDEIADGGGFFFYLSPVTLHFWKRKIN